MFCQQNVNILVLYTSPGYYFVGPGLVSLIFCHCMDTYFFLRDAAPEEVTSTEAKESPVKKSPAKKVAEAPESNGKEENGSGDAPEDTPAENGDAEESNDATENGDATGVYT